MPVRVCHISTVHAAVDVRIFHRECCTLARAGYEVHLVIPAEQSSIKQDVHVHAIPRIANRLARMLVMPWLALGVALKTRAAIYHLHDPELIPMGFVLRWLLSRRVVYDVHEAVAKQIVSKEWLPGWSRRFVAAAYTIAERLLTPGQVIVLANENSVPDYSSRAYLVRNYPLVEVPSAVPAKHRPVRQGPPLLVYVGGVSQDRGGMVYVQLAHRLRTRGHNCRMMIIGPYSEAYGQRLRSEIETLDLTGTVTLTGRTDYGQAMDLVSQATIGMCLLLPVPNYTSCLATKILEYMMFGTPVLASDYDCWRPYVDGERAGMMANPNDIEDVVATCERMLADPEELRAMGERGAAAVRARYNWASEFGELRRCYGNLLAGRGPAFADRAPVDQAVPASGNEVH